MVHELEPLVSTKEMRRWDQDTLLREAISETALMKRAGQSLARAILRDFRLEVLRGRTLVLAGPGNNGGDAFVIASYLLERGFPVDCIELQGTKTSEARKAAKENFLLCGGRVESFDSSGANKLSQRKGAYKLLIDGVLGLGQESAARAPLSDLLHFALELSSEADTHVLALDCPTGMNSDTGEVFEPNLPAEKTYAVQCLKRGMLQYPARQLCGSLVTVEAGISQSSEPDSFLLRPGAIVPRPREQDSHKAMFGRVLVIGSELGFEGAAALSAEAALRAGAGMVWLASPALSGSLSKSIMTLALPSESGSLLEEHFDVLKAYVEKADSLVIGPGTEVSASFCALLKKLFAEFSDKNFVLDAGALRCIKQMGDLKLPPSTVLTPHPGEAADLLSVSTSELQRDRYGAAESLSKLYGATVLLKGASTIVRSAGKSFVLDAANPGLSTAGSGDVLAGVLSAQFSEFDSLSLVVCYGVQVHSLAGRLAGKDKGSFSADELLDHISRASQTLRHEA